ncbi:hypothetical protein E2C01_049804 [Portunus trituberculatus]|uniref:Uncharacterized protein n=1 Tax=Portunus trituberculatus TaxID=210409 RepID=A0A5B7GE84_PORTR|nr:hypothetical protein [Portunus trituberculatus]
MTKKTHRAAAESPAAACCWQCCVLGLLAPPAPPPLCLSPRRAAPCWGSLAEPLGRQCRDPGVAHRLKPLQGHFRGQRVTCFTLRRGLWGMRFPPSCVVRHGLQK